ncbi:uncharacterized protein TNCV_4372981 [Trichonephila clavipes]|uniref:Mutator-like transposase domain-containing protein n=1 Tax=Trichonephila clavipes TaxID=2585209 RepID=A0A8X6R3P7_TRICX|nr:uncharacterized protein TNCV_4372981 [Trichonephila clavipes]
MNALNIIKTTQLGMASKLELVCSSCEAVLNSSFSSACVKEKIVFDINKKMVSSFLRLGKGHAGLELFTLVTGMNAMDKKSFSKHIKILSEENSEMKHQILEVARNIVRKQHLDLNDEKKKETGVLDITVSFDGSWQKRGYKSLYGIGVVIDLLTGLVIDYVKFYQSIVQNVLPQKAIKDNCNDVEKIKRAIYATLYHCSSTDAKPKHNKCPNGKLSWCFFKRALANEESPESYSVMKTKLTEEVVAKIFPVYQRLAGNEIYCLGVLQVRVKMKMKVCTVLSGVTAKKKVSNQRKDCKYLL